MAEQATLISLFRLNGFVNGASAWLQMLVLAAFCVLPYARGILAFDRTKLPL